MICGHFDGITLELPAGGSVEREQAKRYARILATEQGFTPEQIADEVSASGYPVSAYMVREWFRNDRKG